MFLLRIALAYFNKKFIFLQPKNLIDNDNINGNAKTKRDKMEVINLILDKINNYGFDTLSTNELFILEKYSKEI